MSSVSFVLQNDCLFYNLVYVFVGGVGGGGVRSILVSPNEGAGYLQKFGKFKDNHIVCKYNGSFS